MGQFRDLAVGAQLRRLNDGAADTAAGACRPPPDVVADSDGTQQPVSKAAHPFSKPGRQADEPAELLFAVAQNQAALAEIRDAAQRPRRISRPGTGRTWNPAAPI